MNTTPTGGTVLSDADTNMYYLVDNSGGTQNSGGAGASLGRPQTFTLPHATTSGRVIVLIATCRTVGAGNTCNLTNGQVINASQITANVQAGDSIIQTGGSEWISSSQAQALNFTLSLFSDGNHHWYIFDSSN